MKTWFLIILMFISSGYLFVDTSLLAAQGSREELQRKNNLLEEKARFSEIAHEERQQKELEELQEKVQLPLRLAQSEQPRPARPLQHLVPGAGNIIRQHVPPPPPSPEPWYKSTTVLVAIISAVSAIAVALIGLFKRGG
jgi:hypothetical protein